MYACPGLYMPWVGSRQASLNKLIWCTLLCYLLCSGDKIYNFRGKKNSQIMKERENLHKKLTKEAEIVEWL